MIQNKEPQMNVEIKPATCDDAALILDMIIELADYEKHVTKLKPR